MHCEPDMYATLEANAERLRKQRDLLRRQRRSIHDDLRGVDAQLAIVEDLKRQARPTAVATLGPAPIRTPAAPGLNQFDWIIKLLRANPKGLTSRQIVDYLESQVQSKAKNPRGVLSSALSTLRKDGDIELVAGLYRISDKCTR